MAYFLAIFGWSQYTVSAGLTQTDLETDTHANDPAAPGYSSGAPSWVGESFTFNGGGSTLIEVADDDTAFEDGYVETGGAQTLAVDVTIDGTTYPAGSVVENEFALIDGGGNAVYVVRINGVNVGLTYAKGSEPTAGDSFTVANGRDGDPADNAPGQPSSTLTWDGFICFAAGTLIGTAAGARPVEDIAAGDRVATRDGGLQPVIWAGHRRVRLRGGRRAAPIRLKPGSLGRGLPRRKLLVSPQHRFLVEGPEVARRFGWPAALAPARGLTPLPGVSPAPGRQFIDYVHLLLPRHALLFAEGAAAESLYPGAMALAGLQPAERAAILALLPGLDPSAPRAGYGPPARPLLRVGEALDLARAMRDAADALPGRDMRLAA